VVRIKRCSTLDESFLDPFQRLGGAIAPEAFFIKFQKQALDSRFSQKSTSSIKFARMQIKKPQMNLLRNAQGSARAG
jgi:hypothetical protein